MYKDWGTGKPVLFTHPWALNADIWEYQLTELVDQGLRCVAYDRRGHGRSTDPGRGYDYDRLADDLAMVIDRLDLRDITLVGYSMGNGEAIRYLQRHGGARIVASTVAQTSDAGIDRFIAGATVRGSWSTLPGLAEPAVRPRPGHDREGRWEGQRKV